MATRKHHRKARKQTRKLNPYMKFAKKARVDVLKQYPALRSDVVAVAKKIGQKWRSLSATEKARY